MPLTAAYGLLTVPLVIMVVFFLEGIVQALGVPASQAVVAEAAPLGRASAAQGLAGSMNLLAAAVSAFTAPIVYERWGAGVTFSAADVAVAAVRLLAVALRTTDAMRSSCDRELLERRWSAEALDDHGHALAAADAHALHAEGLVLVLQAVDQGGHDPGAGHAERVAEGDRRRRAR